jgi:integrase
MKGIEQTNNSLTIPQADFYNPSSCGGEVSMKNIRMEGYCPICGKFRTQKCPHKVPAQRYFVDFNFKGTRIRRGTNLDGDTLRTLDDAVALRQKAFEDIRHERFNPAKWTDKTKLDFSFNTLLDNWYREKERELAQKKLKPGYVSKLWQYIRLYFHFYNNCDVRGIFNVNDFALWLPERLSLKYQKNILDALQNFFNWLHDNRYITELPKFKKIDVPEHMPKTLDFETQMKLIDFIPEDHKLIFLFMVYQGCRPSEARGLLWDSIEGDVVTYKRTFSNERLMDSTKTRRVTPNRLFPETMVILPKRRFALDFVFVHGKKIKRHYSKTFLSELFRKALESFNRHYNTELKITLYETIKHSFYTQLYNRKIPLDDLRKWGGHTSVSTTLKYAKLDVVNAFRNVSRIEDVSKVSARQ